MANASQNYEQFFDEDLSEHIAALGALKTSCYTPLLALIEASADAIQKGGKLIFLGNGGSAADAQHWAAEMTVRFIDERAPIAAIALTTDTSALTAIANDLSAEHIFARQVEALAKPEDLLIVISTSGNSPNVIQAVEQAKTMNVKTVGFLGKKGGQLLSMVDIALHVQSDTTARVQELHELLGHMFCRMLEIKLGFVE